MLPIIIVGAGPVGLSLAAALAHRGIPAHVYEQGAELSTEARASTFHPPTLEIFAEWGLADKLLAAGHRVHCLQYWERESRELIAEFNYQAIANDTAYPFRLQCPQSILTRLLKPHLEAHPLSDVYMNHRFLGYEDLGTHIIARFETPEGEKTVEGRFLCAADGAHSSVRDAMGIDFEGKTYRDRFLLIATNIDFKPIFPQIGSVAYLFDPKEWVILLQLPDISRMVFRIPQDADAHAVQEISALKERIQRFIGIDFDFTIHSSSIYNVHQRVAAQFYKGNAILLGDAAHINNPMGGVGMNSGIHDAQYLAGIIQRILKGESIALLQDYEDARRGYALNHIQEQTDKNYHDMSAEDETYREARNQAFRSIAADPVKLRVYLLKTSMLTERLGQA